MKHLSKCLMFMFVLVVSLSIPINASAAIYNTDHNLVVDVKTKDDSEIEISLLNAGTFTLNNIEIKSDQTKGKVYTLRTGEKSDFNLLLSSNVALEETIAQPTKETTIETIAQTTVQTTTIQNIETSDSVIRNITSIKSPQTNDNSNLLFWTIMLCIAAIILLLIIKNKKLSKQILSLFLCIAMLAGIILPISSYSAIENLTTTLNIPVTVVIDGQKATIEFQINYDTPQAPDEDIEIRDSDNDGLIDFLEVYLGTDIYNPDTDGDGIFDGIEFKAGLDPNNPDTDKDSDGDGLSNLEEVKLNTDIMESDTDNDGISDFDEVKIYDTNPTLNDTDNDGISDFDEITLGLDPKNPMSDNIIPDSERTFYQNLNDKSIDEKLFEEENYVIPSLSGNVSNIIDYSVYLAYAELANRSIVGYPVEVKTSSENLDLTLKFDCNKLLEFYDDSYINQLFIYEFRENQFFELETMHYDNNMLEVNISKSGTYFVFDVANNIVNTILPAQKAEQVPVPVDIVLTIDTTASMSIPINKVIENIENFVDNLQTKNVNPNIALVIFKDIEVDGVDSTQIIKNGISNWFNASQIDDLKSKLADIYAEGGEDAPESQIDGLETARMLDFRDTINKYIILITDSGYKIANNYGVTSMQETIKNLSDDEIYTYVVTNKASQSYYLDLIQQTGGSYSNIYESFDIILKDIAEDIEDTVDESFWVLLKDLTYVKLKDSDIANNDTDGDELTDLQELYQEIIIDISGYQWSQLQQTYNLPSDLYSSGKIKVWNYKSHPLLPDTDFDGIDDSKDKFPTDNSFTAKLNSYLLKPENKDKVSNINYNMDYRWFWQSNKTYNSKLSKLAILLATEAYKNTSLLFDTDAKLMRQFMEYLGLNNIRNYTMPYIIFR